EQLIYFDIMVAEPSAAIPAIIPSLENLRSTCISVPGSTKAEQLRVCDVAALFIAKNLVGITKEDFPPADILATNSVAPQIGQGALTNELILAIRRWWEHDKEKVMAGAAPWVLERRSRLSDNHTTSLRWCDGRTTAGCDRASSSDESSPVPG